MAQLAPTAKLRPHNLPQSSFQHTKFERLNITTTCDKLDPIEAAHLLAPQLVPYLNITTYPDTAFCFGNFHRISLNVASTDIQYATIEAEGFHYNGRHFTSDTIRKALELAYPEEFI